MPVLSTIPRPTSIIVHLAVHRPLATITAILLPTLAALIAILATGSLQISDPDIADYFPLHHPYTKAIDARTAAQNTLSLPALASLNLNISRTTPSSALSLAIILLAPPSQNILSSTGLSIAAAAESTLLSASKYSLFCLSDPFATSCTRKQPPPVCAHPRSVLQSPLLLGQTAPNRSTICSRRSTQINDTLVRTFVSALRNGTTAVSDVETLLSRGADTTGRASALASFFAIGTPFHGFSSFKDRPQAQLDLYDLWVRNMSNLIKSVVADTPFQVYLLSNRFFSMSVAEAIQSDFRLAGASLAAILVFLLFHTRSPLLSVVVLIQVIAAFAPAFVLFRFVFQQLYFSALNVFSVYFVLGIAVDDVFIFVDAWRQKSLHIHHLSTLVERSYRRAVGAMLITSLTTAVAFAITAFSPLMPIATFGIWTCLLVLMQFLLVATVFPCVLVIWETRFRHRDWPWRKWFSHLRISRRNRNDDQSAERHIASNQTNEQSSPDQSPTMPDSADQETVIAPHVNDSSVSAGEDELCSQRNKTCPSDESQTSAIPFKRSDERDAQNEREDVQLSFAERVFHGVWTNTVYTLRYPLTVLVAGLLISSIYFATRLLPLSEAEQLLPNSHPVTVVQKVLRDEMGTRGTGHQQLQVRILWGVSGVDRTNLSRFDRTTPGTPILDKSFDLRPAEAQWHLLRTCQKLRYDSSLVAMKLPAEERVRCWIEDFLYWRTQRGRSGFQTYDKDLELVLEIVLFGTYLDKFGRQPYLHYLTEQDVMVSNDLKRIVTSEMRATARVGHAVAPEVMRETIEQWEKETKRINQAGPSSMGGGVVTAGVVWPFNESQRLLTQSVRVNIGLMLGMTVVMLTFATRHPVTAGLGTLCLTGVVSGVLAVAFLMGWRLGSSESLIAVVSVGYSFDGIAHVCTAFARGEGPSDDRDEDVRLQRMRAALTAVGTSVVFGTGSTAVSTGVLIGAQILLVRKLAVLVVVTMGMTALWALVLMPAVLMVIGPKQAAWPLPKQLQNWLVRWDSAQGEDEGGDGGGARDGDGGVEEPVEATNCNRSTSAVRSSNVMANERL